MQYSTVFSFGKPLPFEISRSTLVILVVEAGKDDVVV